MKHGIQKISVALSVFLSLIILVNPVNAATLVGSKCPKIGTIKSLGGSSFICVKKGKKLLWSKKVIAKTPEKLPLNEPIKVTDNLPKATKNQFEIAIYSGSAGQNGVEKIKKSYEFPSNISPRSTTDNFKLWIYDPENNSKSLGSPGVFFQKLGGDWKFISVSTQDGVFTTNLEPGAYVFDVVEPNNNQVKYSRGRFNAIVHADNRVDLEGLAPNSLGYYSVSVTLNDRRAKEIANFAPSTPCQMLDQSGSPVLSNAFPRASGRLTNSGVVRALLIPVSFSDLPASGNPSEVFKAMAEGTHNFFLKQSKGKVLFQFSTLKDFLKLSSSVKDFNLGSYNGGNPSGLFKAGLAAADPVVDFSNFDAVYVLPPPTVLSHQIAYGPAFVNSVDGMDFQTQDGQVLNGSVGGADAWQTLPGADWKWMAHETGHLFGLFDWYTLDNTNPYGPWDIMSLNWSTEAIELNVWNRYISGWLDDDQIYCLEKNQITESSKEYSIEVLGIDSNEAKATMVKLSDSRVLVLEARATAGLDQIASNNSGLLVYTVDVSIPSIKGVAKTHSRPDVSSSLKDAPLRVGESLNLDGIRITVNRFENDRLSFSLVR